MVKKARPRNPKRIKDLKEKVKMDDYLLLAISTIAVFLAREILGQ